MVADGRIAIFAGGGSLPRIVARRASEQGLAPFIIPIADGSSEAWSDYSHRHFPWSRTGDVFGFLRRLGIVQVLFCGTISVRPDYRSLLPSLRTLLMLPELFRIVRGGDDSMLRAVAGAFERRGFEVVSVQSIAPELVTPKGVATFREPDNRETLAIGRAYEAAVRLGSVDAGQAVVASADRIIALEGIEGTREMLNRVAELRSRGRIGRAEPCVLFKAFKPQQDERFDLPSIGVETVHEATAAGLAGIALTAGQSLIIGRDDVLGAMNQAGLFLVGVDSERLA
jgi:UDP-2,3-diacylglucosamine hydrolase